MEAKCDANSRQMALYERLRQRKLESFSDTRESLEWCLLALIEYCDIPQSLLMPSSVDLAVWSKKS